MSSAASRREHIPPTNTSEGVCGQPGEDRYAALFAAVADSVLVADAEGRYVDANRAAEKLLGYPRAELVQLRVADIVAREPDWTEAEYARYREAGEWRGELVLRRKDGSTVPVEARATVAQLPDGPLFVSVIRDLSAERWLAAQVRAHVAEIETLYRTAPIGLALVDRDGRFVRVNDRLAEFNGLPATQHIGRTFSEVVPELAALGEAVFRQVLASGEPVLDVEFDGETAAQAGVRRAWRESWYPLKDETGRIRAMSVAVEEITARKRAEAERERLLQALAHDLKNPLAALTGQAQLLQRQIARRGVPDAATLRKKVEGFERLATRSSDLVDELVDHARLAAGEPLELRRTPCDLVEIVRTAVDEAQMVGGPHRVAFVTDVPRLIGSWDRPRLRRVVANLLDNAIKYSPAGGRIAVEVRVEDGAAVLTVSDEGIGIPRTDLPHVFAFQRRAGNVGAIAGSGIGLAGVKWIVEQHGGAITVCSDEGRGSTFTVRLPLTPREREDAAPPEEAERRDRGDD